MSYLKDKLFTLPLPVGETELEPWRKALLDAAEYIRVHGHCKGQFEAPSGEACAVGAIILANHGGEAIAAIRRNRAFDAFTDYLGGAVSTWNDAPERTEEDVIRALTECARL